MILLTHRVVEQRINDAIAALEALAGCGRSGRAHPRRTAQLRQAASRDGDPRLGLEGLQNALYQYPRPGTGPEFRRRPAGRSGHRRRSVRPGKPATFTQEEIASWAGLPYHELAFRSCARSSPAAFRTPISRRSSKKPTACFAHAAVAPLRQLNGNEWVLELFHGPTLAFKDFALQLLGRLLDHVLEKRGERVVIVGATSGDTGSAAIEGCKHCDNVDIFILHPHKRVSEVQRRQMTTIFGENIHNIAIEGNFDDCQEMVKNSFADQSSSRARAWWR
jgi:hypothetical protein